MALKEMYKVKIEPHNLFCVDNRCIHTHTHTHARTHMSLQLGNERHDILVWALNKQRFMYYIW
jgi:hypothetical protein